MQRAAAMVVTGTLLMVGAPAIASCSGNPCLPPFLQVAPATVAPGGTVVLTGPAARCKVKGIKKATYVVSLQTMARDPEVEVARVRPSADASFSTTIRIPRSATAGPAALSITGSVLDHCADQSKCAAYEVGLTISG